MTPFWITILLAISFKPVEPIRVYTGTALASLGSQSQDSKLTKRSWEGAGTPALSTTQQPGLYKIKLTQNGYIQFLRYMANIPPLQQYTFCLWMKSRNYTYNHPIFSYSVQEKDSIVKVWLSPKDGSLKLAIHNDVIARIPLNIREGRWYHICQSWSGVAGEWVVYVDGKLKASDTAHQYRGTFLPGGGDVTVGQELTDFNKGLDDGVEGEIFGFNLVDEAVDLQDSAEAYTHYRPDIDPASFVPSFKKLPTNKKTFDEIHSYISKLPIDGTTREETRLNPDGLRVGELPAPHINISPIRSKPRIRGKAPVRKVVIYRDGRAEDGQQNLLKRASHGDDAINVIPDVQRKPKIIQKYDVNYNMHTYRATKERTKAHNYQIYEEPEEESGPSAQQYSSVQPDVFSKDINAIKRRARHNFDVYSLREANRLNPFYVKPYEPARAKYHFEKQPKISRRSFTIEDHEVGESKHSTVSRTSLPDFIPVNEEVDEGSNLRRKRDADESKRDQRHIHSGIDSNGFRPLPTLPDGFVNIFSPPTSKEEALYKLNLFLSNKTNGIAETTTASVQPPTELFKAAEQLDKTEPQKFPAEDRLALLQSSIVPVTTVTLGHGTPDKIDRQTQVSSKREKSVGSELVHSSYGHCGVDRGSPVSDKRHLLVSWSDTPVRIYGGAMVIYAQNICGHF